MRGPPPDPVRGTGIAGRLLLRRCSCGHCSCDPCSSDHCSCDHGGGGLGGGGFIRDRGPSSGWAAGGASVPPGMSPAAAAGVVPGGAPGRARPAVAMATPIASPHAAPPASRTSAASRRSRVAAPEVTRPMAVISQVATPAVSMDAPAMVRPRASRTARWSISAELTATPYGMAGPR